MTEPIAQPLGSPIAGKTVKCVVWDLDHTVWNGILLEDDHVELRPGVREILRELDERGILQSIASRNDHDRAMARLEALGIADYFLYPHINWNAKGQNVAAIATALNIGLDTFLFVDDQPFEREEVAFACPAVRTFDAAALADLPDLPEMNPEFITDDSRNRRRMYLADISRNRAEESFNGPSEDFLRTLDMRFTLAPCSEDDLQRAEELTVRTNQLNTTGYTIMMSHVMNEARAAGVRLRAEFKPNGRNRMMEVTYRFGGFREVAREGDLITFEHDLASIQPFPEYVRVDVAR
jgi:FkbH-like protein